MSNSYNILSTGRIKLKHLVIWSGLSRTPTKNKDDVHESRTIDSSNQALTCLPRVIKAAPISSSSFTEEIKALIHLKLRLHRGEKI